MAAPAPACHVPRIASDEARRPKRRAAGGSRTDRRWREPGRDHRRHLRQPRGGAGDALLLRPWQYRRRPRFRAVSGRRRRRRPRRRARARPRRPTARRPRFAGGHGPDRGALVRRSERGAADDRRHRHERQDDHGLPRSLDPRACRGPVRAARDGQAGRRRPVGAGRADDARGDRSAADVPADARCRRSRLRDGGLLARALARARRLDPLRRRRLHEPDPGSPRLPRRHGGIRRGEATPVRARRAWG